MRTVRGGGTERVWEKGKRKFEKQTKGVEGVREIKEENDMEEAGLWFEGRQSVLKQVK